MAFHNRLLASARLGEFLLATSALVAVAMPAAAQNATWLGNAGSADYNTATNWSPATVPTGTASFGATTTPNLSFSADTTVGGWTFASGASAYTFTNLPFHVLTFDGAGIVINGGSASITNNSFLFFSNSSTAGSAGITNDSNMFFLNSSTAGSASITNTDPGMLVFQQTSTAGSASITNNGDLRFVESSTAGSASITNNKDLQFLGSSTAGSASTTNNKDLQFLGSSTAGSASITNNKDLQFLINSTAGSAIITNNNFGFLIFAESSTAGSASITNNNVLEFYMSSTAGSASITNNDTLNFKNISTAGSASITNNNAGAVVDFSGGTGPLNDNKVSAGSIAGAGSFYLGGDELTVGSNNLSTNVSGVISDCGTAQTPCLAGTSGGSLVKAGTGTLTLSGTNTYTGGTTISAGTLAVNGSIAAVTVNTGGTLGGTGTVSTTSVNAGGTFAPGAAGTPGTSMTVQGNLAFQSGALYLVQINPSSASFANVTGTATLAGNVLAAFAPGSYVQKQYTILHAAGGWSGSFAAIAFNLPGFATSLSYTGTDVLLNLSAALGAGGGGLKGNQQNVATGLNNFFNGGGALTPGFQTIFGLSGGNLSAALTQLSGETATGAQQTTFGAMTQFMGVMTDPFIDGRGDGPSAGGGATGYADETLAYTAKRTPNDAMAAIYRKAPPAQVYEPRWSVWAAGYGGSQTTDGSTTLGSNTTTSRIFGTAVGADYRFSPDTLAGFALAGGGTNFSIANGGSGRSDLFQAGAFVRHNAGPAYISAALAYGWQDITTDRTITIAGVDQLRAKFNANAFSGRVEGGYRIVTPDMGITPYAAGQFTTFDLPAYAEQAIVGANTFALGYGAKSVTASRSELGVRTDRSWAMTDAIFTLRGRLAWAHDFNPDRNIAATFQTLPGASFVVDGAALASDAALVTASAETRWLNGFSVAATFEGEFSDVTESYAGKGVVRYAW